MLDKNNTEFAPADGTASTPATTTAEILRAIDGWTDLAPARRATLASHVRRAMEIQAAVAGPTDGPVRFTCEALNATLWRRAPACFGIDSSGSFNNLISSCRFVLRHLGLHAHDTPLSPEWQVLYDALSRDRRKPMVRFLRYLSLVGATTGGVTGETLDAYEAWCAVNILKDDIGGLVRGTASGWNWASQNVSGWPQVTLHRRDMRDHYTLPLDAYPASFQSDAKAFLDNLSEDPLEGLFTTGTAFTTTTSSPRSRPRAVKPRTRDTREHCIRAAAAARVQTGTPVGDIRCLKDLVHPTGTVGRIIQFHYQRRKRREASEVHETRPTGLIAVAETLRQIAKFHCRLPDEDVKLITSWKSALTPPAQGTMSDANRAKLRALLEPETYAKLIHLPATLLKRARALWDHAKAKQTGTPVPPPKAARLVMYATALEILLFCPLRRKDLVTLDMGKDLVTLRHGEGVTHVSIRVSKTREPYEWELAGPVTDMIALWVKHYRPALAAPGNPYLFPGMGLKPRNESEFGDYFGNLVEREVGAEFNMHLSRHFAVVRYLRRNPGQYAIVSRLLGHKKVQTTIAFYAGLEANAAAAAVNKVVLDDRARTRHVAVAARRRRGSRKGGA
jgi:integrase